MKAEDFRSVLTFIKNDNPILNKNKYECACVSCVHIHLCEYVYVYQMFISFFLNRLCVYQCLHVLLCVCVVWMCVVCVYVVCKCACVYIGVCIYVCVHALVCESIVGVCCKLSCHCLLDTEVATWHLLSLLTKTPYSRRSTHFTDGRLEDCSLLPS